MFINVERARSLMDSKGVDLLISATVENNRYFGGFWIDGQELFPHDAESYTVVSRTDPAAGIVVCSIGSADLTLGGYPTLGGVVTFGTFFRDMLPGIPLDSDEETVRDITDRHVSGRGSVDALIEAITSFGIDSPTIAVDERGPNRDLLPTLRQKLPSATIEPASSLLREIRAVKTPAEIDKILATLHVTEEGLRTAFDAFKVGVTERELQQAFNHTAIDLGAKPGFALVRFGRGLALGQIPAGDRALTPNDFAFFDVGVNLDGYKSDIGRLVFFGDPDPGIVELFAASKAGQQAAIDAMRPGVVASDVFDIAVQAVRDAGIPSYERQHVGHGVGIEYYDLPVLAPQSQTVLEEGMTFEVETPYYRMGVGGAFIEDTVVIREDGAEIVTTLSRDTIVLPVE